MYRQVMLGGCAMALALAVGAGPAMAGSNAELLKRLHEKGILTDEEYQSLLAGDKAETVPVAAAAPAPAPAPVEDKRLIHMTDSGVGMEIGGVTFKVAGQINGFYTHDKGQTPGANTAVTGGVVASGRQHQLDPQRPAARFPEVRCHHASGWMGHRRAFRHVSGHQQRHLCQRRRREQRGQNTALQTAGIDFRQTYMTVGRPNVGEFKLGRDIGLFGSEGILNDITLLSVGTPGGNVAPSNTSLGRIGVGYIYTDFQPQITYTTPNLKGLTASVGVFEPLQSLTGPGETSSSPGFQGKIVYDGKIEGVTLRAWLSGITQRHNRVDGVNYTGQGFDTGAKLGYGPITVTGITTARRGLAPRRSTCSTPMPRATAATARASTSRAWAPSARSRWAVAMARAICPMPTVPTNWPIPR
jgi:hypothetical protein